MSLTPKNVFPQIGDKLAMSPIITFASSSGQTAFFFYDATYAWQIWEVRFIPTTAYIASNAATFSLGKEGSLTAYVNAFGLGTGSLARNTPSGAATLTATKLLPAGTPLVASWTQVGGQSGAGVVQVRLRPVQPARQAVSKAPTRATAAS